MQAWSGQYSSSQAIAPSATAFVNCRALVCAVGGTVTVVQGPIGAQSAPQTITLVAGTPMPIELNCGLLTAATATGIEALS